MDLDQPMSSVGNGESDTLGLRQLAHDESAVYLDSQTQPLGSERQVYRDRDGERSTQTSQHGKHSNGMIRQPRKQIAHRVPPERKSGGERISLGLVPTTAIRKFPGTGGTASSLGQHGDEESSVGPDLGEVGRQVDTVLVHGSPTDT